jgi:Ca-activated chloride channel homolog
MSALRPLATITVCALACGVQALAQNAAPPAAGQQQPPLFTTTTNEVIVPVTVTDDKGRYVSNLEAKDFRILDEGKPQLVKFFNRNQKQPIVVGFLVDMSNNTKVHWKRYQEAVESLVFELLPGDKRYSGYLIQYANDAEILVNTTSDFNKIADKLRKMKPGGGAAFYDAIYKACVTRELVKGEPYEPRRILIVVGDGHDNASKHSLEEVLEIAQRNLVTIYAMSTQAFGFANENRSVLEKLAAETGGHVEYPLLNPYKDVSGFLSNPSDAGNYAITVGTGGYEAQIAKYVTDSIANISGEINTQYVLRYVPDVDAEAKPKAFRKIEVTIPDLPNVKVSARKGYFPEGARAPAAAPPGGGQ